ncbi:MAG: hypothetical protein KKC03_03160 [Bacteroidetes bacterium]|nr:hypothetical protein [Bacteroidota bacterium]
MKKLFFTAVAVLAFSTSYGYEYQKSKLENLLEVNLSNQVSNGYNHQLYPLSQENAYFNKLTSKYSDLNINQDSQLLSIRCWIVKQKVKSALREVGLSKEDAELVADVVKTVCEALT